MFKTNCGLPLRICLMRSKTSPTHSETGAGCFTSGRGAAVASAFRAGEVDRLEVGRSRLLTLAARHSEIDALERVQTALGALEDAVQSPLGVSLPAPRPETAN